MRTEVLGSIPLQKAVAAASAIPPSTHTAWPTHALGQGISSLSSTFLPNNTHGQNNPVKPTTHKMIPYSIIYYEKKQKKIITMGAKMKAYSQPSVSSRQPRIPVVQSSSAGGSYLSGRYCPHSMHFLCTPKNLKDKSIIEVHILQLLHHKNACNHFKFCFSSKKHAFNSQKILIIKLISLKIMWQIGLV